MRTSTGDKVYEIICGHHGREQAITAKEIARLMMWPVNETSARTIRRIIQDESVLWENYVCAREGYYIPATDEEIINDYGWVDDFTEGQIARRDAKRRILERLGLIALTEPALRTERSVAA